MRLLGGAPYLLWSMIRTGGAVAGRRQAPDQPGQTVLPPLDPVGTRRGGSPGPRFAGAAIPRMDWPRPLGPGGPGVASGLHPSEPYAARWCEEKTVWEKAEMPLPNGSARRRPASGAERRPLRECRAVHREGTLPAHGPGPIS